MSKETGGFFRKVVRFVANPATDWNELNSRQTDTREMELEKLPGVAETIDWTQSLDAIGAEDLTPEAALDTLGAVVKDRDDLEFASRSIQDVVA